MQFTKQSGEHLPPLRGRSKYPWSDMLVEGDFFIVEGGMKNAVAARVSGVNNFGLKLSARELSDGSGYAIIMLEDRVRNDRA